MADTAQRNIRITKPKRSFEDHTDWVTAGAIFPDGHRMVTSSRNKTLRVWDLKGGVVLKKLEGDIGNIWAVAVSGDGQLIASGDEEGRLIAWHGETGKSLTQSIAGHHHQILSLDFSPDGTVLATGSWDSTIQLWNTTTWQVQGKPINCDAEVNCVRFSPSGELVAIATDNPVNPRTLISMECITKFKIAINSHVISLVWTPDCTRLLSAGTISDPTIREWDTSTWRRVGDPWSGHTSHINALAVDSTGTLLASASSDNDVRLWRLSDRQTIAIFTTAVQVFCVTFSMDGKHILSGGEDKKISEWAVPKHDPKDKASEDMLPENASEGQVTNKILPINPTVRNACIIGNLPTAEELLTQEIDGDGNYNAYASRSVLMARKGCWDNALHDALQSITIQPSLLGYVSQGIALCGTNLFRDAMKSLDLAFMFTDGDSETIHILLLIKAIALFNGNRHEEAMLRVQELAAACPNIDTLACRVVEAYLRVQLGINALSDLHHNEAADHFTAAINGDVFSSEQPIHSKYEVFVVLFGWDLKSLWKTSSQKRCLALLRADRLAEAHEAYRYIIDMADEATLASCRDWCLAFEQECLALSSNNGDTALAAKSYDTSIQLYSIAIELDPANDAIFAKRCKAKLEKLLWEDALLDAQKVTELNPSYLGHQLKHAALHGAQRYDEAIAAFEIMLSKLNDTSDTQIRKLLQQYATSSEAGNAIQEAINVQLENTPHRLINTVTGRLCDRGAQMIAFKMSAKYKELFSLTMKHRDLRMERIEKAVEMYFRCVMLSHRWEENEPLLRNIQNRDIYGLNPVGGIAKLQSFCKTARGAGYLWAWVDTCCIDQTNNVEVQQSVNSMFVWYRHAVLTIVYLSDVLPLSKSGALAKSVWNKRGWSVQEFLAPKVVLFYQKDWTLYLDDRSPNHKESNGIMRELGDATGIDAQALVAFHPGMSGAREKLQWASMRVTTLQEDIAYSLFGIFGVNLPVIYGERKQNALGRLLQEVVAQSGDITCLDWVGKSSEFNSCLPASIASYGVPPSALPSPLSEDEIQTLVFSLRDTVDVELASRLYQTLNTLSAPQFAARRLRLHCIAFAVTEVRPRRGENQESRSTFAIKADGLHDLCVNTDDEPILSRARPAVQSFLLVRPWHRSLLDLPDFTNATNFHNPCDTERVEDLSPPVSLSHDSPSGSHGQIGPVDSQSQSRALRLIVRLGQPFSAFLLAQQWGGEYTRIASDQNIIVQVKDKTSIHDMMDIRTLEIL